MTDTIEIIGRNECSACFSCVNSCPMRCISMETGTDGSLYPLVDKNKCIQCGRCIEACPTLHELSKNEPIKVFAAYSKDLLIRKSSTSGGVTTEIVKYIVKNGGVAYGAAMIEMEVRHIRVDSVQDIGRIQGSKYVHSHMYDIYKQVESDVKKIFQQCLSELRARLQEYYVI